MMTRYYNDDDNDGGDRREAIGRGAAGRPHARDGSGSGSGSGSAEGPKAPDPRVSVLELQSSVCFGVGSLLLLMVDASFVRAVASCLLALHVVPELCLDGGSADPGPDRRGRRTHPHGRYVATAENEDDNENDDEGGPVRCGGSPQRRRWNRAQSVTFLLASVAQAAGYGFLLQIQRQPWVLDAYLLLHLVAAALWMMSGLMVVLVAAALSRRAPHGEGCRGCPRTVDAGLVQVGNAVYVLGCVGWLTAAAHQYRTHNEAVLGGYLQRVAAGLWAVAALLFVVGDGRRLCGGGRRQGNGAAAERGRDHVQETSSSSGGGDEEEEGDDEEEEGGGGGGGGDDDDDDDDDGA